MATAFSLVPAGEVITWHGSYRTRKVFGGSFALTVAMVTTINNTISLFTVPKGFTVLGVTMDATQMDSSTGLTLDLGDGTTANKWVQASTIASSTGGGIGLNALLPPQTLGFRYTADTAIVLKIHAAPSGTISAGTVVCYMDGFIDA